MAAVTFDSVIKDLKNKAYHPVYFLHGDEPYYIDLLSQYIETNVLSESEREFNLTVVYGRDVNISTVISYAKQFPMMSNYQVVIVREAQDIKDLFPKKKGVDGEEETDSDDDQTTDKDLMVSYLEQPQKSTLLVFCYKYKKIDRRTKAGKLIESKSVCFESKKLYDEKIPAWIRSYITSRGYRIAQSSCDLLAEYLGTELSKVANELDKLMINVPADQEIKTEIIEKNIGISKDFNVFELQKAIARRDHHKVHQIINYFGANPKSNPFIMTVSTLNSWFNKIITYHVMKGKPDVNLAHVLGVHPFFLRDYDQAARTFSRVAAIRAISILHEYDLRSKGVNNSTADDHDLLREMVWRLLHPESELIS
jgi:DNA polymerase III subunit delta